MGYKSVMNALLRRPTAWIALVVVLASAAAAVSLLPRTAAAEPLSTVSVHDMRAALLEGALVLDVREPFEYAEGHVEGTTLVPLATVAARASEFAKDAPVYVFCRSGNRSLTAARELVAAGFSDVRNVDGGIIAWNAARLPIVR
jgi:rhodanese-related sulfurtransferase